MILFLIACGGDDIDWSTAEQWKEVPGETSWEWILPTEELPSDPPEVDYLGLDGLDVSASYVSTAAGRGTSSWCYLSVGSVEEWRDDYDDFLALDEAETGAGREGIIGNGYSGWADEWWLNVGAYEVFMPLMEARLDVCVEKGFDLVEYDNMEIDPDPGFDTSPAEVVAYVEALLDATEQRGLGAIHKNATDLMELEPRFEVLLLEDCVLWDFCDEAQPYLDAGKPVFNAEYPESWDDEGEDFELESVCESAGEVSTLIKKLELDASSVVCAAVLSGG